MSRSWTQFIASLPDLSVLSDETLERAQTELEKEVAMTNIGRCNDCRHYDHCYGSNDNCYCPCTDMEPP